MVQNGRVVVQNVQGGNMRRNFRERDRGLNDAWAIKFYTKKGIGMVLSANKAEEGTKNARKIPATNKERILSCIDAEEKIIINDRGLLLLENAIRSKKHRGNVSKGIKANPSKVKAVTDLKQPRVLKDIQSLNGKLAALSRLLSKGARRSLPLFKVLKSSKGKKKIQWTDDADKSLKEMKKFVQALLTLTVSKESINAALFAKRSERQILIYFISRVSQRDELNYPALEKLILALVHAARRLRRYF
uniref:Protein NYNRIN-like n=1 Tax=Tanacetum cinerariifolium TaxID=118510 RepID=A0A6L2L637_TANCI|nr:protein NYNRIN-like [Tanacetum cinerariifolium]